MKILKVKITERHKLIESFNLAIFREEIVNFMYKKTVANSSRNSMVFYVLIFFLSLKVGDKSLLRDLLDKNISKLKALNEHLSKKDKLKTGQYKKIVTEVGLQAVFKYDVFFLLVYAVTNSDKVLSEFKDFFAKNPVVLREYKEVILKYKDFLENFQFDFEKSLIIDERTDYNGNVHDLSKSVNRTIIMRTSRRLDLPLHRYAELKSVSSNSPLIVDIIQYIKPEIITHIWQSYKIDEYVNEIWDFVNNNAIISGIVSGIVVNNADKWLKWSSINGNKDRKAKTLAKLELDMANSNLENQKEQQNLINLLSRSVMSSNQYLQTEVAHLKSELERVKKEATVLMTRKGEIKELTERIKKLENVDIEVVDISD